MKDTYIQWHPGFVAAMNLELRKNRDDLLFEKEYNLTIILRNMAIRYQILTMGYIIKNF